MAKSKELNSLIHTFYDSESEMAESMGWSRQRLNRITTGKKVPDLFEVNDIAVALRTPFLAMARIFLGDRSTIVDNLHPDPLG